MTNLEKGYKTLLVWREHQLQLHFRSGNKSASNNLSSKSPPSPKQFQETMDTQWVEDNKNTGETNGMTQQWTELSQSQIPVPVSASLVSTAYKNGPTLNRQNLVPPSNVGHGNNFNTRNIISNQFDSEFIPNGFYFNNFMGVRETATTGLRPQGGMQNSSNGWVVPNTGRLLTRPGCNVTTPTVRKPKRIRTAFTSQQMMVFEQEYARKKYLDRIRRKELAGALHLNERTIKIWFQNRRMKEKKDKSDSFDEEEASSTTELNGIPVIVEDQFVCMEQYPVTSLAAVPAPLPMPQTVHSTIVNTYPPAYIPKEFYTYRQQVHSQMQSYVPPPPYNNQLHEIVHDSVPLLEEMTPAPVPDVNAEENWDISWLKSN